MQSRLSSWRLAYSSPPKRLCPQMVWFVSLRGGELKANHAGNQSADKGDLQRRGTLPADDGGVGKGQGCPNANPHRVRHAQGNVPDGVREPQHAQDHGNKEDDCGDRARKTRRLVERGSLHALEEAGTNENCPRHDETS